MAQTTDEILTAAGIRPTSNRVLVLRAIMRSSGPQCLADLEAALQTLEKSSVSRVLNLLLEHGVIHAMEDGRGITRYEMCHGDHAAGHDDLHPHFYCERCHRVVCLQGVEAPRIPVPDGYCVHSTNCMLKGLCPDCRRKSHG